MIRNRAKWIPTGTRHMFSVSTTRLDGEADTFLHTTQSWVISPMHRRFWKSLCFRLSSSYRWLPISPSSFAFPVGTGNMYLVLIPRGIGNTKR
ncbi:unnamed protein product [Acanthoscelides obtectus]|uniref:Uncharacterized protein n=1 Tax=Acanthoscelides obtectus TaxID=200917 RepID=A0A9P0PE05_ACAOB|nr:unnamed protein product [Acanthoscelides obtectus]CAK1655113.1 hypothetical protein AOBTE_LOCUS19034 [Acanthoscelides obtectus]